jgi:S-DNA-T family DNA segregation ATPase FtsK/SpoIIIE
MHISFECLTRKQQDRSRRGAYSGDDWEMSILGQRRYFVTSYIQRKLCIGYNKAARLVEQMEDQGVVTRANHVGKREILVEER